MRSQPLPRTTVIVQVMAPERRPATTATRWLDPVEAKAWRNFIDSTNALQHVLEEDVVPFGLTMGDYEVLVRLSERPERRQRMCDLAGELRLSPSGLTRRLDGLVRSGLVSREPSSDDRRVMLAVLTDAGYDLLVEAAPHHVDGVRKHFIDRMTPAEVSALGHGVREDPPRPARAPGAAAVSDLAASTPVPLPLGFRCHVANIGIKDDTDDFVVVVADAPCSAQRRVHPQQLRRAQRARQPPPRRRSPGAGRRRDLQERQRRDRPAGPRQRARRSSPVSPSRLGLRAERRADRVHRRHRPPVPDGPRPRRPRRAPVVTDRHRRRARWPPAS